MIDRLKGFWCKTFHRAGYPIHDQYTCPNCLRVHKVTWHEPYTGQAYRVFAPK